MNFGGWLALVSAWLCGGAIVMAAWPRDRPWREDFPLLAPLGAIVGFASTSVVFTLASLWSRSPAVAGGVIEAVGTLVALRFIRWRGREEPVVRPWTWPQRVLATLFAQAVAVAAVVAWRAYRAEPYGGWDGWAIWNLHARLMRRAGTGWPAMMDVPQLNWTHPDYPRLVPASVARAWGWAGGESPAMPALISVVFAAAVIALLVATVMQLRGRTAAFLGGLLAVGTPFFVTFAANEHADIPLSAFMLGAVALLVIGTEPQRPRLCALAGICAAAAAWTKNEGLLFAVVIACVVGLRAWREVAFRRAAVSFAIALALALVPVIAFKLLLAPASDLAAPMGARIAMLADVTRHVTVLQALWRDVRGFGEWAFAPWIAMVLPFLAWRHRRRLAHTEQLVFAGLGLMLAGYYFVYVTTPKDLAWHLDASLVRLLLQLWPLGLLTWGLALPEMESVAAAAPRLRRPAWVVTNLVMAAGFVAIMSGQRAADELAAKRVGLQVASVGLGDGWFGIERHARDVWAWSAGDATLRLRLPGGVRHVRLEFSLRSLSPRRITLAHGSKIVWQGEVGDQFVAVKTPEISLPDGSSLEIKTDAPGVAESADPNARKLAFAIYNLRRE